MYRALKRCLYSYCPLNHSMLITTPCSCTLLMAWPNTISFSGPSRTYLTTRVFLSHVLGSVVVLKRRYVQLQFLLATLPAPRQITINNQGCLELCKDIQLFFVGTVHKQYQVFSPLFTFIPYYTQAFDYNRNKTVYNNIEKEKNID